MGPSMKPWVPAAILVAAALIFLAWPLTTSKVLLPADLLYSTVPVENLEKGPPQNPTISDVIEQLYPYYVFLRKEITAGRIPLWNPYVLGGTPFLATSVSAVFAPLQALLLWMPPRLFFEWSALFKLLIGAVGVYFYTRRLGAQRDTALVSASAYIFSGYLVYFLVYPNTAVAILLAWQLYFLEGYLKQNRPRDLVWLSLTVCAAFLSGHLESAFLQALALGFYTLWRNWRKSPYVAGVIVLGFFMAALAILPFLEFLSQSGTLAERTGFPRNPFYVPLKRWAGLLIPYALGSSYRVTDLVRVDQGAIYTGLIPLFLATLALRRPLRQGALSLTALAVATLLIFFGIWPFFDLFTSLPLLRQGKHSHIVQVFQTVVCVLAAFGFSRGGGCRRDGGASTEPIRGLANGQTLRGPLRCRVCAARRDACSDVPARSWRLGFGFCSGAISIPRVGSDRVLSHPGSDPSAGNSG